MSIHIGAAVGEVAETVLLPGDPLRAKFIAERYLEEVFCYNQVRGMYGYTGKYNGKRVSVQGSGMGMPSLSIYAHELITCYGVKKLIRVGTCGAMQPEIKVRDLILAMSASTNSHVNRLRFQGMDYAPTASFELLQQAYTVACAKGIKVRAGNIFSTDTFYNEVPELWKLWAKFGVLAVEMETAELYTLAAKFKVNALSVLTVSDSLVSSVETTADEREKSFTEMMEIALEIS
ncbi:MAG TPA: purine-nucleoside phosphorylase [Firmicutes bacterium]|nr:purine-nucleoside phosphorylase [Bacillota bacterium]